MFLREGTTKGGGRGTFNLSHKGYRSCDTLWVQGDEEYNKQGSTSDLAVS